MDLLYFILIGLVAGWAAGTIMKGRGFGILGDIIVGILGAILGGYIFDIFGIETTGILGRIITAIVGAIILLAIAGMFKKEERI